MDETQKANQIGRDAFASWQTDIQKNIYAQDKDYIHTIQFTFGNEFARVNAELDHFGEIVPTELERLVSENNLALNLPRLDQYNAIGTRIDKVVHHPSYIAAGNIIYGTKLLEKMAKPGGLTECLSFLFLSAQVGEAGHNCPIACSAGIIRLLVKTPDVANRDFYLAKLTSPSFETNFTGAQFLTEIQGGSDVGLNASYAQENPDKTWKIYGEKWFCSNAGANLIFMTARYDNDVSGTKGLGLFLVPALWQEEKNHYTLRRLKDKIGTRSMATGEIDFHGALAYAIGEPEQGIHLVMDNVLHLSRLFNSFCVLGMARRAYFIALAYAKHRVAFSHPILQYPLVQENLARIKAENTAMIAAIFATAKLQDQLDLDDKEDSKAKLLLRLLVNIQKTMTAYLSVQHVHHALDVLAGNGTIETFSPLPRLLRDCLVCENWEGTHNLLRAQVQKDILKYQIDQIYLEFMQAEAKKLVNSDYAKLMQDELIKFTQEMRDFRALSPELQSLQIRLIVDKMGVLYCALMLIKEALDLEKVSHSASKLNCFHLFKRLHIDEKELSYNQDYLKLVSQIIS